MMDNMNFRMPDGMMQQLYGDNRIGREPKDINKEEHRLKGLGHRPEDHRRAEERKPAFDNTESAVYDKKGVQPEKQITYKKPAMGISKKTGANEVSAYDGLSDKAKEYLEQLKEKFGNVDFFVADVTSDEEMNRYFAMGQKEYTCVISSETLEQMAADEEIRNRYEGIIAGAGESFEQIKQEVAAELGEDAVSEIGKIGITVDNSGVVTYMAKLKEGNDSYYAKVKEELIDALKNEIRRMAELQKAAAESKEAIRENLEKAMGETKESVQDAE